MPITSLAVFCGSRNGIHGLYTKHAQQLGEIMAQKNIEMIYGGGSTGIMGIVADAVMQHNGKVTGIIPHILVEWEHQHHGITKLIVADDMHERKKKMYELCDAAIILPGGFGTLDEFFEMLTWNQLSIHDKQIFILNSGGFFDHLLAHIDELERQEFLYETAKERITVLSDPAQLYQYLS
ncbi:MAG TPA: TIGR00730 family Rossman fold protein [Chitinophagaceae bacterium]|nr:TIGR00730 family Rossman fold protein [Chitinophagaceae bacterium]